MLVAILVLATVIMVGVGIQHPVALPATLVVATSLGFVLRALVQRLQTPHDRRGATTEPAGRDVFAALAAHSETHPVRAVAGYILVSGATAFLIGAFAVRLSTSGEGFSFAVLFGVAAAIGGGMVGTYQVRRARRE
jgi:hypothetical protein